MSDKIEKVDVKIKYSDGGKHPLSGRQQYSAVAFFDGKSYRFGPYYSRADLKDALNRAIFQANMNKNPDLYNNPNTTTYTKQTYGSEGFTTVPGKSIQSAIDGNANYDPKTGETISKKTSAQVPPSASPPASTSRTLDSGGNTLDTETFDSDGFKSKSVTKKPISIPVVEPEIDLPPPKNVTVTPSADGKSLKLLSESGLSFELFEVDYNKQIQDKLKVLSDIERTALEGVYTNAKQARKAIDTVRLRAYPGRKYNIYETPDGEFKVQISL